MPDYVRGWVKLLEADIAHFKKLILDSPSPASRRAYLTYVRFLERARDMFILGAVFEAASLRAKNHEASRRGR